MYDENVKQCMNYDPNNLLDTDIKQLDLFFSSLSSGSCPSHAIGLAKPAPLFQGTVARGKNRP